MIVSVRCHGVTIMTDQPTEAEDLDQKLKEVAPRPWVRYWARMFDVYLFSLITGIMVEILYPETLETSNDAILGVIIIFVWVFVESIFLCVAGTTPGKFLLKVRLFKPNGRSIEFNEALTRSFRVWWRGMGVGIPFVALFTLTNAYNSLKIEGASSWDRDSDFIIMHEKIGWIRVVTIIAIFLAFLGLIVL